MNEVLPDKDKVLEVSGIRNMWEMANYSIRVLGVKDDLGSWILSSKVWSFILQTLKK